MRDALRGPPLLSKSRYLAGRQCHLRLWYECHERHLASQPDAGQQAIFDTGHEVGELATLRHPGGVLIEADHLHHEQAVEHTAAVLADPLVPAIFEAAFTYEQVRVRADILVRLEGDTWDLVEVKSALNVKDTNLQDLALQSWVVRGSGLNLRSAGILTLNKHYVYGGAGHDLQELFAVRDHTEGATLAAHVVEKNVADMHAMVRAESPPVIAPGEHCAKPYPCPFWNHCTRDQRPVSHPLAELPSLRHRTKIDLLERGIDNIAALPDDVELNGLQKRVRDAVFSGVPYVSGGLAEALAEARHPIHHLDFETFMPAVPRYVGSRPFHMLPFQWSNHIEHADGRLQHEEYLCRRDEDSRQAFAETLIESLGEAGSICIYTRYERTAILQLAEEFPLMRNQLLSLVGRVWDLHAVIKAHYYHQDFHGSFSLKAVLPVLVPGMSYQDLAIGDGQAASRAHLEAISTGEPSRRFKLQEQLLAYCGRDTLAMVKIRWALAEQAGFLARPGASTLRPPGG